MTFDIVAGKLQDEIIDIIESEKDLNEYELIVFKYVFISELKIPVHDELGVILMDDSFILYLIPDDLEFNLLRDLDDVFSRFKITFMPNSYGLIKLKFTLMTIIIMILMNIKKNIM